MLTDTGRHIYKKNIINNGISSLSIFILGWNIWYFILFFSYLGPLLDKTYTTPTGILRFCLIGQVLMIIGAISAATKNRIIMNRYHVKVWISLYIIWVAFLSAVSFSKGHSLEHIWWNITAYIFPLYALIGINKRVWKKIFDVLTIHLVFGVIAAVFLIITFKMNLSRSVGENRIINIYSNFLYPVPILFLCWGLLGKFRKILVLTGLFAKILISFLNLSRGSVLFNSLLFVGWLYIIYKTKGLGEVKKKIVYLGPIVFIVFIVFISFSSQPKKDLYYQASTSIMKRFSSLEENFQTDSSINFHDIRYHEAYYFLTKKMNDLDWVIGKGMNATWNYFVPRQLVHVGYINFIFVGGIPLLLFFLYFPLVPAIKCDNQDIISLSSKVIILIWYLNLFIYGRPEPNFYFVVLGICIGPLIAAYKKTMINH